MVTHPTVVVGVGQAGINVMSAINRVAEENGEEDMFKFLAIDSDKDTLNDAPTGTKTIPLQIDDDFSQEDVERYPYLTRNMKIEGTGAKRQRPVGRYKVDGRGDGGYDHIFQTLNNEIEAHYSEHEQKLAPQTASFNIFFVHSFGGGTGSGSYPLVLSILHRIAQDQLDANDKIVYLGGVGIVPEIPFDPEVVDPPGDQQTYYPNAYAAYEDLKSFTSIADSDESTLELDIWSRTLGKAGMTPSGDDEPNTFEFHDVPFDDYWLVGVHEDKISGSSAGRVGPESYAGELNQKIARAIHAVSRLSGSAENWSNGTSFTGTFAQAEIRVPHEEVERLVELQNEIGEKERRIETKIPDAISSLEDRRTELEELKRDLDPETQIDDDDLKRSIRSRLTDEGYRGGEFIVENKTAASIEETLDDIEESQPIEALIVATEEIRNDLESEKGARAVEEEWEELIQSLWSKYTLQSKSEYGGGAVRTTEGKASVIEEYLDDKINEYADIKEDWDATTLSIENIKDTLPPVTAALESEREYAQRWLEVMQDDYSDLERVIGTWDRVSKMLEAVEDRRSDIRSQIDDQISDINEEITELQEERDALRKEVRSLQNDVRGVKNELTTEKYNERMAVLPIKEDRIDDIDDVALESELDSLMSYIEEGYVSEDKLRWALNDRVDFCKSWDLDIIDRNMLEAERSAHFQTSNEFWFLFNEANREFQDYMDTEPDASTTYSGDDDGSNLQHLSDPYRIEYLSYTRRGPVSAFEAYQRYQSFDDDGWLEQYANQYDDYLQAFAYLEWYGRDVKEAFDVRERARLSKPPELERERVDKPDLSEDEKANYITTNGIDSYLWNGNMWDAYESDGEVFRGWKNQLSTRDIGWTDIQKATPEVRMKQEWLADQRDWDEILDAYRRNLIDQTGVKIVFEEE